MTKLASQGSKACHFVPIWQGKVGQGHSAWSVVYFKWHAKLIKVAPQRYQSFKSQGRSTHFCSCIVATWRNSEEKSIAGKGLMITNDIENIRFIQFCQSHDFWANWCVSSTWQMKNSDENGRCGSLNLLAIWSFVSLVSYMFVSSFEDWRNQLNLCSDQFQPTSQSTNPHLSCWMPSG